jgi:ferrous iron transport protein A
MEKHPIPLTQLPIQKRATISSLEGGSGFQRKLRVMGIREGCSIMIVSKQPFRGPLTIAICGSQMTLGRGMASRIFVEDN